MSWSTPGHQGPTLQQSNAAPDIESEFSEDYRHLVVTLPVQHQHQIPEYQSTELMFFMMGDSRHSLGAGSYAKVLWAFCSRDKQDVSEEGSQPAALWLLWCLSLS